MSRHLIFFEGNDLFDLAHFFKIKTNVVLKKILVHSFYIRAIGGNVVEIKEALEVDSAVLVCIMGADNILYAIILC